MRGGLWWGRAALRPPTPAQDLAFPSPLSRCQSRPVTHPTPSARRLIPQEVEASVSISCHPEPEPGRPRRGGGHGAKQAAGLAPRAPGSGPDRSKLPAEGLAEGAVLVWDLFPQQPASVEGARNLALPAQEETEKIQCCWLAALSPLLPTQGCAQGTETLLSAAPGPAIQGAGGGRRSQKEALNELQRQSHLLHSFTDRSLVAASSLFIAALGLLSSCDAFFWFLFFLSLSL